MIAGVSQSLVYGVEDIMIPVSASLACNTDGLTSIHILDPTVRLHYTPLVLQPSTTCRSDRLAISSFHSLGFVSCLRILYWPTVRAYQSNVSSHPISTKLFAPSRPINPPFFGKLEVSPEIGEFLIRTAMQRELTCDVT